MQYATHKQRTLAESCYQCQLNHGFFSPRLTQVYSLTSSFVEELSGYFAGGDFVSYDEFSNRPWGFMQVGVLLAFRRATYAHNMDETGRGDIRIVQLMATDIWPCTT